MPRESGVLAGISADIDREMRLVDVNPEINHTSEDDLSRAFHERQYRSVLVFTFSRVSSLGR